MGDGSFSISSLTGRSWKPREPCLLNSCEPLVRKISIQSSSLRLPYFIATNQKVGFERVPDLVEKRKVFLRGGKAFLPISEQQSLIVAEFSNNVGRALEVSRI